MIGTEKDKKKSSQKGRKKSDLPANPARRAWLDSQRKHIEWKKTWKPCRDIAASWF